MPHRPQDTRKDLPDRIVEAALQAILNSGTRQAKSAQIAALAGTSESTMFRHFKDIETLFQAAYDRAWQDLNNYIYVHSIENPIFGDATDQLAAEFDRLWALRDEPAQRELHDSVTVAFTYLSRPLELGRDYQSENQRLFQSRITARCQAVVSRRGGAVSAETLQEVLTTFAATVWLTGQLLTPGEQLTPEVARLGVLGLIDRLTGEPAGDRRPS